MELTADLLRARGIDLEPEAFLEAVLDVVKLVRAVARPQPGREGLSAAEMEVLTGGGLDFAPRDLGREDPLAMGLAMEAALVASGLSTEEAAQRLGVTTARIRQRLTSSPRTLLGVSSGRRGGWRIPSFQFTEAGELPAWSEICAALPKEIAPLTVFGWLTTPDPDLEGPGEEPMTPRAWLLAGGDPTKVVDAAGMLDTV